MANIINGTDTGSGGLITTGDSSDELQLQTAETARVTLTNTAVVVNEGGEDVDFRVEGDTEANLLFVDAGNDRVGIGTGTPTTRLTISNNTVLPSAGAITGTGLWQVGADSAASYVFVDSFGIAGIVGRRAGGTSTSPTAPTANNILFLIGARGYGSTAYSSADRAAIYIRTSEIWTDSAQGTYIRFDTTPTGSTTTAEVMRIDSSGNLDMTAAGSGNIKFKNGSGIDFSASAGGGATSSVLDDYEEGTFTPTLTPASGSTPLQGSYNTLSYTKIGRVVTITGQIVADTPSSATGTLTLGNLPFALANIDDLAGQARPSIHIFCNGGGAPATGYFSAFIGFSEGGTSGSIVPTYNATYDSTISDWIGVGSDIFVNFSYITT